MIHKILIRLLSLRQYILLRIFVKIGGLLFDYVSIDTNAKDEVRSVIFRNTKVT